MKKIFLTSSFADVSDIFEEKFWKKLFGKTLTFIPTASLKEEVNFYVVDAKKAFLKMGILVDELEISNASKEEIFQKIHQNEAIYISWWNTFFLLQELQKNWADKIIFDAVLNWKLYIWESAGSMVAWSNIAYVKEMDDEKVAENLLSKDSLWLVDFSVVPHFWNFSFEKATKNILEKYSTKLNLKPISNNQAILVENEKIEILKNN